eukprot:gene6281-6924_t
MSEDKVALIGPMESNSVSKPLTSSGKINRRSFDGSLAHAKSATLVSLPSAHFGVSPSTQFVSPVSPVHRFPIGHSPLLASRSGSMHGGRSPVLPDGVTVIEETMSMAPRSAAVRRQRGAAVVRELLLCDSKDHLDSPKGSLDSMASLTSSDSHSLSNMTSGLSLAIDKSAHVLPALKQVSLIKSRDRTPPLHSSSTCSSGLSSPRTLGSPSLRKVLVPEGTDTDEESLMKSSPQRRGSGFAGGSVVRSIPRRLNPLAVDLEKMKQLELHLSDEEHVMLVHPDKQQIASPGHILPPLSARPSPVDNNSGSSIKGKEQVQKFLRSQSGSDFEG